MKRAMMIFAAGLLAGMTGAISSAAAASCQDLWHERNAIYDQNGYCFSTQRGKQTFDNSDCWTKNPDLSQWEQRRVAEIKAQEKRQGCTTSQNNQASGQGNSAPAASCWDLWYERNAIYDRNGFCFSTQLGKQTFNNADCWTKNPSLSSSEQRRVGQIKAEENRRGCKVN